MKNELQTRAPRVAWVVGGGSGIGLACVAALAARGWQVAVSGRRSEELQKASRAYPTPGAGVLPVPCDVTREDDVAEAIESVTAILGAPSLVVHAAGVNVRNRHWDTLDARSARTVFDVNVAGAMNVLCAAVPRMRERGQGTIVVVSSWAGWRPTAFTGPAYSASKLALAPLVESINEQEGGNGLRATLVCPGEVNTPILSNRSNPPAAADLARMLQPQDVADAILFAAEAPPNACINELVISPSWNRIYREPNALMPADRSRMQPETERIIP